MRGEAFIAGRLFSFDPHVERSDEQFVGYLFGDPPDRRPRLWFLERHLLQLASSGPWSVPSFMRTCSYPYTGVWSVVYHTQESIMANPFGPHYPMVRYTHRDPAWTESWQLTLVTIPRNLTGARHVFPTFGRSFSSFPDGRDDVWRLGIWPD